MLLLRIVWLDLYPFFIWLFIFLWIVPWVCVYILGNCPLSYMWLVKVCSLCVGWSFVLLMMCFALEKLLSFIRFHLMIINLGVFLLVFYSASYLLGQCIQGYFPLPSGSVYVVLLCSLWCTWTWVLCWVIDTNLFTFFYMPILRYSDTICSWCFLFFTLLFWLLCQRSMSIGVWI